MSHVADMGWNPTSLEDIEEAGELLGMEMMWNQTTFNWWGHHVGDYPLPEGFTVADMGKCTHALRIKGNKQAYEVGVVVREDKIHLLWDFYAGGRGLMDVIGKDGEKLRMAYNQAALTRQAKKEGWEVNVSQNEDGLTVMDLTREKGKVAVGRAAMGGRNW